MPQEPKKAGSHWRRVGGVAPRALVEARVLLHHAAQLVTAAGRSLLPPRPDDGQTAFEWIEGRDLLAGEWLGTGSARTRVALEPATASLLLLGESGERVARRDLSGGALAEAFAWLGEALAARGIDVSRLSPSVPYEVPHHAVASGDPFPPAPLRELAELTCYFADGHRLLTALAARLPSASPLRCWPHHFDLGALLTAGEGASASSVGLGLSPGDGAYPEPYLYVTVWPAPARPESLPSLPGGGHWHREGWFGAVLTGTCLVEVRDAGEQEACAREFLEVAVGAGREIVGLRGPDGP
jgi:hypothetical protein